VNDWRIEIEERHELSFAGPHSRTGAALSGADHENIVLIVTFAATTDSSAVRVLSASPASMIIRLVHQPDGRCTLSSIGNACAGEPAPQRRTSEPLSPAGAALGRAVASGSTPGLCRSKDRMVTAAITANRRGCSPRRRCSQALRGRRPRKKPRPQPFGRRASFAMSALIALCRADRSLAVAIACSFN
jgi:hypothetical protein